MSPLLLLPLGTRACLVDTDRGLGTIPDDTKVHTMYKNKKPHSSSFSHPSQPRNDAVCVCVCVCVCWWVGGVCVVDV